MKNIFTTILFLFSLYSFAQTDKHIYKYSLKVPDLPNYVYFRIDTLTHSNLDKSSDLIKIHVIEKKDDAIPFLNIKIIAEKDTQVLSTDRNGIAIIKAPFNNFKLLINHPHLAYLDTYIAVSSPFEKISEVTVVLGKSFRFVVPILKSKRPLTSTEIIGIITDIQNSTKKSKLILDKTCILEFEI